MKAHKLFFGMMAAMTLAMPVAQASVLPPNDLYLQDSLHKFRKNGMSEELFHTLIDKVERLYQPIVTQHGGRLSISRRWEDPTVNASAMQLFNLWHVSLYGGLARRDEVTPDAFTLAICHEIGHHLGGFPFVSYWGANEGAADYFAAHACARLLWQEEAEVNATHAATVDAVAKEGCDAAWQEETERHLCYRIAEAGQSLATLLAAKNQSGPVSFSTPDTQVVTLTFNDHPNAQCRLDTYFAASLCARPFDSALIPGRRFGNKSGLEAEREAAEHSCHVALGDTRGVRSSCWFASRPSF